MRERREEEDCRSGIASSSFACLNDSRDVTMFVTVVYCPALAMRSTAVCCLRVPDCRSAALAWPDGRQRRQTREWEERP
jgi:hypothetical protein